MRKKLLLMAGILSIFVLPSNVYSQSSGTINFDNNSNWTQGSGLLTSYRTDHEYSQNDWLFTGGPALRQTSTTQDGFPGALGTFSWRLNSPAGTEFLMISNSEGPVEEFGFSVRRWDGNPSPNFIVEYSTNGGSSYNSTGTTINNAFLNNSSDWISYSYTLPSPTSTLPGQFIIRLRRSGVSERIMIDDFTYSIGAATPGVLSSLRNSDCSRLLTTMNKLVYARISGADSYTFEVTNLSTSSQQIINKSTRDFNLTELSNPIFDTEYQIRVQTVIGGQSQPIGAPCVITSPTAISQLRTVDCGKQLISFAHLSYANITSADQWEFEATNLSTMAVESVVKMDRSFSLNDLSNPTTDVAYSIRVRVLQNGTQQPYGNACEIFAPNTQQLSPIVVNPLEFEGLTELELVDFKKSIEQDVIFEETMTLLSYPNPFSSAGFSINLSNENDILTETEITIIDITGKVVYQESNEYSGIINKRYGHDLLPGIYTVRLVNNNKVFLSKVVRQ